MVGVRIIAAALCTALALPAVADPVVDRTLQTLILPAMNGFAATSAALAAAALADCRADAPALKPAFHTAFDAWLAAAPYQLGPIDSQGQSLPLAF